VKPARWKQIDGLFDAVPDVSEDRYPRRSPDGPFLTGNFSGSPMETFFYSLRKNRFDYHRQFGNLPRPAARRPPH
jgi:hypothetical protein